jgi:hypothetical protein
VKRVGTGDGDGVRRATAMGSGVSGAEISLLASVFLACPVEAVTIVLAVGTTRSPSSLCPSVPISTRWVSPQSQRVQPCSS